MARTREERLALNEAVFRAGNERMAQWEERDDPSALESYLCECSNTACKQRIKLTRPEYEAVRADPRQFAVVPGHATLDTEDVVKHSERFDVVYKHPEVTDIVEATDPRREQESGIRRRFSPVALDEVAGGA
jgi:hypothetical protein